MQCRVAVSAPSKIKDSSEISLGLALILSNGHPWDPQLRYATVCIYFRRHDNRLRSDLDAAYSPKTKFMHVGPVESIRGRRNLYRCLLVLAAVQYVRAGYLLIYVGDHEALQKVEWPWTHRWTLFSRSSPSLRLSSQ